MKTYAFLDGDGKVVRTIFTTDDSIVEMNQPESTTVAEVPTGQFLEAGDEFVSPE